MVGLSIFVVAIAASLVWLWAGGLNYIKKKEKQSVVIFIIVVRYVRHKNVNYIVVDSTLELDGMIVPIQMQVNIQNVKEIDRSKVFRVVSVAFNRHINFNKSKVEPKKSWWQKIFNS